MVGMHQTFLIVPPGLLQALSFFYLSFLARRLRFIGRWTHHHRFRDAESFLASSHHFRDDSDTSFVASSGGFPKFPDALPSFNGDDFATSCCLPLGGIC
jgi:hypothetical protein